METTCKTDEKRSRIVNVTANTCVRDLGQYVESFILAAAPGTDLSGVRPEDCTFENTAKHPAAGHESFGAWKTEAAGPVLTVSVDPFLYNDTYQGSIVIEGETISLSKADVDDMRVSVVDDFQPVTTENGLAYRLLVPESDGPLPLIVTFHGNGERGTDNYGQMVHNRLTTKWGEPESQARYKCVVLGPQSNNSWSDEELKDIRGIIDRLIEEKIVDPARVYAYGMAAFQATIRFAAMNADLLAGVVSMIYWKKYTPDLTPLAQLPIWMVIAENDPTGESGVVKEAYQYLKEELHNEKMKCIIYSDEEMASYGLYGGQLHWCWIPTLNNKEISDWLFAQKKE
ncbi:MAG: hypothetical protein IJL98_03980 [Lachnospiraceae bacterium]|nr:hypothetical protein [Lachnospiraceae bacterium]